MVGGKHRVSDAFDTRKPPTPPNTHKQLAPERKPVNGPNGMQSGQTRSRLINAPGSFQFAFDIVKSGQEREKKA